MRIHLKGESMNIFTCPVCSEMLYKEGKSYICPKRHTFDIAKSGYVNLLISKQVGKTVHGDNKLMVKARRDFLEKGYYGKLLAVLSETVAEYAENGSIILDSGCGEGYYTKGVYSHLKENGIEADFYGVDISDFDSLDAAVESITDFNAEKAKELFAAAGTPESQKRLVWFKDGQHSRLRLYHTELYDESIKSFLTEVVDKQTANK